MAKLIAPLLSFSARGTIADTITYSGWKGIEFARQRVIPANPRTLKQMEVRNVFSMLNDFWQQAQALARAPWDASAAGNPYTGRNRLLSLNVGALIDELVLDNFVGSPGVLAGPVPLGIAAGYVPATDILTVTLTPPTLPLDWTFASGVAIAFPDQDPSLAFIGPVKEAEDVATPDDIDVLAVALPLGNWQACGWYTYLRPDEKIAYSPGLTTQFVVS